MNSNDINYKFVKIIEPIRSYYKTFKTIDEFNNWYLKNKSEVDEYTTHKLNKMYNVEGYRITRIKGSLCLKKVIPKHNNETSETCDEQSSTQSSIQMHEQIISMKNEIQSLKKSIKEIIDYLNNNVNVENV